MGRTKLEIDLSVLGRQGKAMHIIVGSRTTCSEVVQKVLDKCRVSEPPVKYQLAVTSKDGGKGKTINACITM